MSNVANEVRELVAEAVRQGWRLVNTGSHYKLFAPDGIAKATIPHTPSDHRWRDNAVRDLRKGGFVDPKATPKRKDKRK